MSKEGFIVPVARCDANTLIPIQEFIIPRTTIISDCGVHTTQSGQTGTAIYTVNYSVNFVNPVTFTHTNTVENCCMRANFPSKKARGTKNDSVRFARVHVAAKI